MYDMGSYLSSHSVHKELDDVLARRVVYRHAAFVLLHGDIDNNVRNNSKNKVQQEQGTGDSNPVAPCSHQSITQ